MRIHELFENYDFDGHVHEVPRGNFPLPDGYAENFIEYVAEYIVGDTETAYFDYREWYGMLDDRWTNGGDIYRVLFVKKGEEIEQPFGEHWSMGKLDDDKLHRLWGDVCNSWGCEKLDPYRDNGYEMVQVHARTGPRNVSIEGVNLPEEYAEWEVNLINPSAIEVVKIERLPIPYTNLTRVSK